MASAKLTMLLDLSDKLFNSKFAQMQNKFNQGIGKMKMKFSELTSEIPGMGRAMDVLGNKWVLLGATLMAVGSTFVTATSMANDWHTQLAEVNVTAGLSQKELQGLSNQLLDIGARNVAPLEEVPKAFNRIISSGLSVNKSLEALEPTLRAAKAGFTDIETVASAGIATMMSSGKDINQVYDVLFQTVKEGNATFKDIATYMPKIIPLARSIGYELEGAAGAFASLTTKLSAEQSTTALEGIMRSLANPNIALGKMNKKGGFETGFKSLGIDVFDQKTKKIKPLITIIEALKEKMKGLSDQDRMLQFGKLGLDQSSALGFSTLMQDIEGLKKATLATSNAAGSLNKAYFDSLTPLEQWAIIQNKIKAMMIKLGEKVLPLVRDALDFLSPIIETVYNNFEDIVSVLKVMIPLVIGLKIFFDVAMAFKAAALATEGLTVAQWALNLALDANPIGLICAAIALLIAYVTIAIVKWNEFGAAMLMIMGPIGWIINGITTLRKHWDSITEAFQGGGILAGLKRIGAVLLDVLLFPLQQILNTASMIPGLGFLKDYGSNKIKELRTNLNLVTPDEQKAKSKGADDKKDPLADLYGGKKPPLDPLKRTGGDKLKDDVNKVTGDAKQIKNITINIDSLNKGGINMNSSAANGLTLQDVENWFNEAMIRTVRNAETS
jgi:TP901 family phage tail tape measure protein